VQESFGVNEYLVKVKSGGTMAPCARRSSTPKAAQNQQQRGSFVVCGVGMG